MFKNYILTGAVFGALAVALGAFGAHGLKPHLSDYQQAIYEKAVQYQFYHALALLLTGMLAGRSGGERWLVRAGWLFELGIILFSGSLYVLACRDLLPFPVGWAGPLTPLGGIGLLGGWCALGLGSWAVRDAVANNDK